eukprot:gene959-1860_t
MVLTEKQKKELLSSPTFSRYSFCFLKITLNNPGIRQFWTILCRRVSIFKEEAGLGDTADVHKGLLEKKWTSVVRLQRKVMELEAKLSTIQENGLIVSRPPGVNGDGLAPDSRNIPKGPAKATLSGHRAPIASVALHPTYSLIASASEDATIKMWDYETAQYERTLKGHTGPVTCVAFDPTGTILASCSADMSAKLWDMTTFQCTKTLRGHDHTVSSVIFMPSSDQIITCSRDQSIKCWEVSTGFCVRTYTGHSDWVRCLSMSHNGEVFASAGNDHTIIIWKPAHTQPFLTLRGHEHVVESVCFGRRQVGSVAVSAAAAGASVDTILSIGDAVETVYLASGSRDRSVRLWDVMQAQCLMVFTAHENWVRSVIFHPNGKYIISASDDKSIRIMDIKVTLSPSQHALISASVDKNICVWGCN